MKHEHLLRTAFDDTGARDHSRPLRARSARSGGDGRPEARQRRGGPRGGRTLSLLLGASCLVALVACGDDTSATSSGGGGDGGAGASTGTSTQSGNPTSSGGGEGGGSGSTSTSTSTGGEGGAGGSTSTGVVQNCVPEDLGDGEEIGAGCAGWFVDPSADEGVADGSRDAPYATLERALQVAEDGDRIYVCGTPAGPQTEGALTIERSVDIHGGWGCATWTKFDGVSRWTAGPGEIPLRVVGDDVEVLVQGFAIEAASAVENSGGSSVAVVVFGGSLEIADSTVTAGDGASAVTGTQEARAPRAMQGANGDPGCDGQPSDGGAGGTNTCGVAVNGGSGGIGRTAPANGGGGDTGLPLESGGSAGDGEGLATCGNGGTGGDGGSGDPGDLAPGAVGLGALTPDGFSPAAGGTGGPGTFGSGGGGGGGARTCSAGSGPAASGGGGGAGGCGGAGGAGGAGGGASIGILAIDADIVLRSSTVTAASGGDAAGGVPGQLGQEGGFGGSQGAAPACPGGGGGTGGQGGSGGGGRGGHSLAIAYTNSTIAEGAGSNLVFGTAGLGGAGGVGVNTGGDGAPGVAAEQQEF